MPLKSNWVSGEQFSAADQNGVADAVNKLPQPAADQLLYVSTAGDDADDGLTPGGAKLTIAAALSALPSGGLIQVGAGDYTESAITNAAISDNITIRGVGHATQIFFDTPNSSLITLSGDRVSRLQLQDLQLRLTANATNSILLDLSNVFKNSFRNVTFNGEHVNAAVSTFKTQTGIRLRDNAGDNTFTDCGIHNFGNAVRTDCIMNYFVNCMFSSNWKGVVGGDPTGAQAAAGISMVDCTLTGGKRGISTVTTDTAIEITGSANIWWLQNVWIEGCDKGIVAGSGTFGPAALALTNVKVAAAIKCIDLVCAGGVSLLNVGFFADPTNTPTELTINANTPSGFAANIDSSAAYDLAASTFPAGWTYFPRDNDYTKINRIVDANGATAVMFYAAAAAQDYLRFRNGVGDVSIEALGGSTNIGVWVLPKGNEGLYIYSPAGVTPALRAYGADANNNLDLWGRGTGVVRANGVEVANISDAKGLSNNNIDRQSQVVVSGTAYYMTGSTITLPNPLKIPMAVGTKFVWSVALDKTAAGTGAFEILIYRGVNGTTADTLDVAQTIGTQTAAVDNMVVGVEVVVTTTGATGAYYWTIIPQNKAITATGFGVPTGTGAFTSGTKSAVALNTASLKFGLGFRSTTGTPTITIPMVQAQAFNIS